VGARNKQGRPVASRDLKSTLVVHGLSVVPTGYQVSLYWAEDRSLVFRVNNLEISLHPWVGVYLEANRGRSWKREVLGEHQPNELANYLKKIGG
jgi:hypothetical protein